MDICRKLGTSVLIHHDHTFFLAECDPIFNDLLHAAALQAFRVLLFFDLVKRLAARRPQVSILRIFSSITIPVLSGV